MSKVSRDDSREVCHGRFLAAARALWLHRSVLGGSPCFPWVSVLVVRASSGAGSEAGLPSWQDGGSRRSLGALLAVSDLNPRPCIPLFVAAVRV